MTPLANCTPMAFALIGSARPRDYQSLLKAIGGRISLKEVRHVDTSRSGLVVLTFANAAECGKLQQSGFTWNDMKVAVQPFVPDAVSVRITGCWYELDNNAISSALSPYGKVVSGPTRECIVIGDCKIETDVRLVTCVLSKSLPASLGIGPRKVRVHHRGQVNACFMCQEEGHFARDCPRKQKQPENLLQNSLDQDAGHPRRTQVNSTRSGAQPNRTSSGAQSNRTTSSGPLKPSALPRPTTSYTKPSALPRPVAPMVSPKARAPEGVPSAAEFVETATAAGTGTGTGTPTMSISEALATVVGQTRGKKPCHQRTPEHDHAGQDDEKQAESDTEAPFTPALGKHTFRPRAGDLRHSDPQVQWILEFEEAERQKRTQRLAQRSRSQSRDRQQQA